MAYGNGTYVGVGGSGAVAISPDGLTWKTAIPGTLDYFPSIAFGNEIFVAGWADSIITSSNGIHWTRHPGFGYYIDVTRIRHAGGLFVAIASDLQAPSAVIYTSQDGIEWTLRLRIPRDESSDAWLQDIAYGNGRFIITGQDSSGFIYTSPDGIEWTRASPDIPQFSPHKIAFTEIGFVLLEGSRKLLTSADGIAWEVRHELEEPWVWRAMTSAGNRLVCLAGHESSSLSVATEDGISWQQTPLPSASPRGLFTDGTTFLALGESSVLSSPDGIAWTEQFTPHPLAETPALADVAYGEKGFIAVGSQGTILASREGASWETRDSGTGQYLSDVIHGAGRYVAAGSSGALLHSTDCRTWTAIDLGGVTPWLGPLAHAGGRFVLLTRSHGSGFYWISDDGLSWELLSSGALGEFNGFSALTSGNGRFLAAGGKGSVALSEDGLTWQRIALPEPNQEAETHTLIFHGARFIAATYHHGLLASLDGRNWTTIDSTTLYSALGHGDGRLLAVKVAAVDPWYFRISLLESSLDGSSWTNVSPFVFGDENRRSFRFAYGAGRFVGVGSNRDGTARLLISGVKPPLLDLRLEAAKLVLRIDGAAGSSWNLEHSSTLAGWETIEPVTLGVEPRHIEVAPPLARRGFWRLSAPNE